MLVYTYGHTYGHTYDHMYGLGMVIGMAIGIAICMSIHISFILCSYQLQAKSITVFAKPCNSKILLQFIVAHGMLDAIVTRAMP